MSGGMIGKMIANHDRDMIIVSDRRSHYGKMIMSDVDHKKCDTCVIGPCSVSELK